MGYYMRITEEGTHSQAQGIRRRPQRGGGVGLDHKLCIWGGRGFSKEPKAA